MSSVQSVRADHCLQTDVRDGRSGVLRVVTRGPDGAEAGAAVGPLALRGGARQAGGRVRRFRRPQNA